MMSRLIGARSQPPARWFWPALAVCVAAGWVHSLPRLARDLNVDEPWSANLAAQPWSAWPAVLAHDPTLPAYFVLLKLWTGVAGDSEVMLRLPSLLAFGLTILVVGWLGRWLAGPRAGLLAAASVAGSVFLGVVKATSARPYAFLGLETAVAFGLAWAFLDDKRRSRGRWLGLGAALTLLNAAALLTHPLYAFFLGGLVLAVGWGSWRRLGWLAAAAVFGGLLAGLSWGAFLIQTLPLPAHTWMSAPQLSDGLMMAVRLWGWGLVPLGGALAWGLIRDRAGLRAFLRLPVTGRLLIGLGAPLGAVVAVSVLGRPLFEESRFAMLVLTPASLLGAVFLAQQPGRAFPLALLALGALPLATTVARAWEPDPYPTQASVQKLLAEAQCGDTVVMAGLPAPAIVYYFRRLEAPACLRLVYFPAEMESHPGWMDEAGLLRGSGEALTAEAAATAAAVPAGARAWLVYGSPGITRLVAAELERRLGPGADRPWAGNFFDRLIVYPARAPGAE